MSVTDTMRVGLQIPGSWVRSRPGRILGDWSWNNFYCHSSADCWGLYRGRGTKYPISLEVNRQVSILQIRKYHNHKLQTNPWLREEEPLNNHETPGRQLKQSNQLSLFPIRIRQNGKQGTFIFWGTGEQVNLFQGTGIPLGGPHI